MKVLANLALVAYLSASISALPTPDGPYGNSIIARSEAVADGTDSFGSSDWKKRGESVADATDSFGSSDWKKRGESVADATDSFGSSDW
ncbi:hypothetical protein N7451_003759 [Penicillium sp. IBT 35674x]|nr:hypothetical protein N7451_003759 [Penicillium sp. IBT 35674x]